MWDTDSKDFTCEAHESSLSGLLPQPLHIFVVDVHQVNSLQPKRFRGHNHLLPGVEELPGILGPCGTSRRKKQTNKQKAMGLHTACVVGQVSQDLRDAIWFSWEIRGSVEVECWWMMVVNRWMKEWQKAGQQLHWKTVCQSLDFSWDYTVKSVIWIFIFNHKTCQKKTGSAV